MMSETIDHIPLIHQDLDGGFVEKLDVLISFNLSNDRTLIMVRNDIRMLLNKLPSEQSIS